MQNAIDAIVQVRLDSTRLPRKAMLPINGKALIAHIVERLQLSQYIRNIIIATTEDSFSPLRHILREYSLVKYYVGERENVLSRYYMAARMYDSRVVVRVTGDNPLTDPEFLDKAVDLHLETNADLTHYLGIPLGTGVEVISIDALRLAQRAATLKYDREHVTPYIYKNRTYFKVMEPEVTGLYYAPDLRVTVDNLGDYLLVRELFMFYQEKDYISMEDIVYFCRMKKRLEASELRLTVVNAE